MASFNKKSIINTAYHYGYSGRIPLFVTRYPSLKIVVLIGAISGEEIEVIRELLLEWEPGELESFIVLVGTALRENIEIFRLLLKFLKLPNFYYILRLAMEKSLNVRPIIDDYLIENPDILDKTYLVSENNNIRDHLRMLYRVKYC